jgi:hypothetical protein
VLSLFSFGGASAPKAPPVGAPLNRTLQNAQYIFFFFLNLPFPFLPYGFYGTFRSAVFQFIFLYDFHYPFFLGDATGLRGTFPSHPRPFHLTFTDIHNNIYTPMGAFPDGTRTRVLTSRWWPKEC